MPLTLKGVNDQIVSLDDRLTSMEQKLEGVINSTSELVDLLKVQLTAPPAEADDPASSSVETDQVGTVGQQYVPEIDVNSLDGFLIEGGPGIMMELQKGNQEIAASVTDWATEEGENGYRFFMLWFAAIEEVRKILLLVILLRGVPISETRMEVLMGTLPPEGLQEVREAHANVMKANMQAASKQRPVPPTA